MRNYLTSTALVLGLMASVVLGAYVYWSYLDAARSDAGGSVAAATDRAHTGESSAAPGASEPNEAVFVHRATRASVSSNSTYLNNRLINGNPDAVLSTTQNWNPGGSGGKYNEHPVGVWYDARAERWAIFNQDRAPMPVGAAFNVIIAGPASPTGTR